MDEFIFCLYSAISSENKGHKLLQKMGWKEGQSLGKSEDGISEPVSISSFIGFLQNV